MIRSAMQREEEIDGTTYPIMSLEEQSEMNHMFDTDGECECESYPDCPHTDHDEDEDYQNKIDNG